MSERSSWADRYSTGIQSALGTAVAGSEGAALTNHPALNPGQNIIDTRKAIGLSYRHAGTGFEFQQGTKEPSTTWEFHAGARHLARALWGLFQTGASEVNSTPFVKYYIPWEAGDAEIWLTLVRAMAPGGTSSSHRIIGAVPATVTLSAEEGGPLTASADMRGYDFEDTRNIASDTMTIPGVAPLLWQNAVVSLGGTTVNIPGFTITVNNNLITKWYDAQTVSKFLLSDMVVEGSITIPWAATTVGANQQIDDFIAGNVTRFVLYWGTGGAISTTDADFSVIAHIRRTGADVIAEDEIGITIPFIGASGSRSYAGSVAWTLNSATITGTTTAFDSYSVGDIFKAYGATTAGNKNARIITAIASATSMTVSPAMTTAESTINYFIDQTPCTITLADATDINIP